MKSPQNLIEAVLPKKLANNIVTESRNWMARCACGFERSIWELGGIRWKAAGTPRRLLSCPQCGRSRWHTIYKRPTTKTP